MLVAKHYTLKNKVLPNSMWISIKSVAKTTKLNFYKVKNGLNIDQNQPLKDGYILANND